MGQNLQKEEEGRNWSDKIVEYILTRDNDEFETLSVDCIAKIFNIDRRKLWRIFKIEKKISIDLYLRRIKLTQAAILLRERNDLTVKEIGEKMGYNSYGYFISFFKRYFGTTPGRYKELVGSKK
jgi:AraC-like DNA-binding protein